MTDHIDHAAEIILRDGDPGLSLVERLRAARALANAGMLVTPEHDRAVAAQALREWLATWPNRYVGSPIYEDGMTYADRIERGETDA